MDWLGENNQFQSRRNFLADYPQWDLFLDWEGWQPKWAIQPVQVAATQTPVKGPKVVGAVTGFRPAAFAACGKTRG